MKKFIIILIRCTLFVALFGIIFSYLTDVVRRDDDEANEIHAFYSEHKNTIDVLFLGSSPLLRGVSPMILFNEFGVASYVRASALQPQVLTYALLEESFKTQKPKLVVILADNIFSDYDYEAREGDLRRGFDGMKLSVSKIRAALEVVKKDRSQSLLSYLFPLLRYHERIKEVKLSEIEPIALLKESFKKGNVYLRGVEELYFPDDFMKEEDEKAIFDDESRYYIEKSIELIKENGAEVLLIHLPKLDWSYSKSIAIEEFAKDNGARYLDMDREDVRNKLNINPGTMFYDKGHLNLEGSKVFTLFLGEYLISNYSLENHKADEGYSKWNEDYLIYEERTK